MKYMAIAIDRQPQAIREVPGAIWRVAAMVTINAARQAGASANRPT